MAIKSGRVNAIIKVEAAGLLRKPGLMRKNISSLPGLIRCDVMNIFAVVVSHGYLIRIRNRFNRVNHR